MPNGGETIMLLMEKKAINIKIIVLIITLIAITLLFFVFKERYVITKNCNKGVYEIIQKENKIHRGDKILIYIYGNASYATTGYYRKSHVLRVVIGLPGEKIKLSNEDIFINDKNIYDYPQLKNIEFKKHNIKKSIILGGRCYFVLDDQSNTFGIDSRIIGCINQKDIVGKLIYEFPY